MRVTAAGPRPDAFLRLCPSRDVIARLGDKWASLALIALKDGPLRFGGLLRKLDGVSQKMLSQTLHGLERDGIVTRTVQDVRPLRVDYQLTSRGVDLVPVLASLKIWAEKHLHDIQASNRAFDRRSG